MQAVNSFTVLVPSYQTTVS